MKFKLENTGETLEGAIVKSLGNNEFVIKIGNNEHNLKILHMGHDKIEFMLDNSFHITKYLGKQYLKDYSGGRRSQINL